MSEPRPGSQLCLNAYAAACDLMPPDLLRAFILIGGAATIAQGSPDRTTEDANIAASEPALAAFWSLTQARRGGFQCDAMDESITWDSGDKDCSPVKVEILQMPGPYVSHVLSVDKFRSGYVATIPELVRMRAFSVVDRGLRQDFKDFRYLVDTATKQRLIMPSLSDEDLKDLLEGVMAVEEEEGFAELGSLLIDMLSPHNLAQHNIYRALQ